MKASRAFSYAALAVSLFFSILSFSGSIFAILWYFCIAAAETASPFDLLKFVYFRSPRCGVTKFSWHTLKIFSNQPDFEVDEQSFSSQKTFMFLSLYFIVNFLLIISALVAYYGLNRKRGGRNFNYYALCVPWIFMNFLGILLDLTATAVYMTDYFRILSDYSFILILIGVKNYSGAAEIIMNYRESVHLLGIELTINVYSVTSKMWLPLISFFIFGLLSIKSMWEVVSENKRNHDRLRRT